MWGTVLKVVAGLLVGAAVVGIAGLVYHVVQERITRKNASALVRKYLDDGNYNLVDAGLTNVKVAEVAPVVDEATGLFMPPDGAAFDSLTNAEVVDVSYSDGDVYVAIEVAGKKCGLRSSYGTSLYEGEKLMV